MYDKNVFNQTLKLYNEGYNLSQISRELNINRTTIRFWINGKYKIDRNSVDNFIPKNYIIENNLQEIYSYILGLYLGDGYINKQGRTYKIRFFLDAKYQALNEYVKAKLSKLFPRNKVNVVKTKKLNSDQNSMEVIYCHNNYMLLLFPQHGPNKKHQRKISLEDWQLEILDPKSFLTGLFHSDGSYYFNNNSHTHQYCFSNYSKEIIELFRNCLSHFSIEHYLSKTQVNDNMKYQVFITRKKSVENLNSIIGTKLNIL